MANVAVLGAGVAGLYAAWRLRQQGHQVTILEAKPWAGGLSQTARDGSLIVERDPNTGELVRQTAHLPEGHYVNTGPGRLPHHHRRILGVCRELGVPLEPYIMSSDANYYASSVTRKRYRRRRLDNDVRGHIAAMAYKAAFDDERDLVRSYGALNDKGEYSGTDRAPTDDTVSFEEVLRSKAWQHQFFQPLSHFWQDTLFQPVGGMDQIWRHLLAALDITPMYNAPVQKVELRDNRARVTWDYCGLSESATFDWVLSSVPLPLLSRDVTLSGFPADWTTALGKTQFAAAAKVGWYSKTRWWEDEEIYGGISYTDHDIWQVWYPSSGHFGNDGGTLTGAYCSYAAAERLSAKSIPDRITAAREGGSLIHAELANPELVPDENALAVAHHRVPYQAGGWADWSAANAEDTHTFQRLQEPAGRFIAIGEQLSPWPGWQEGCVMTGDRALSVVNGAHSGEPDWLDAPHSLFLTTGDHPAISYT